MVASKEGWRSLGTASPWGGKGGIKADMFAKMICVEGFVKGTLQGGEKIILSGTGSVRGNLSDPRVVLEEGSRFKGSIDTGDSAQSSAELRRKRGNSPAEKNQAPQRAYGGLKGPD